MKRIISLMLITIMLIGTALPCYAAGDEATKAADRLYELGLFSGTGTNPAAATCTTHGSSLTLSITAAGDNALTIAIDPSANRRNTIAISANGSSFDFHWDSGASAVRDSLFLYIPGPGVWIRDNQDLGIEMAGTYTFEVYANDRKITDYTAAIENEELAACAIVDGNVQLTILGKGPNAIILTYGKYSSRMYWD